MRSSPTSKQRLTVALLAFALACMAVGVWASPPIRRWAKGPTDTEVALDTEKARSGDLKRRLDDATAKLRTGRPVQVDAAEHARAEDLKRQVAALEEKLKQPDTEAGQKARADDLAAQVRELEEKLAQPRPPMEDAGQRARADDLAAQVDQLSALLGRPRPAIEPPVVATLTKQQIVQSRNLLGLYTTQSPFSYAEVDLLESTVERKANIVGYFQSWQDEFRPDAIREPWKRGQVPLMTWESQPQVGNISSNAPEYSLPTIINGSHDEYIRSYARGIKETGLPLIIRFNHEMNGTWYPWSEVRGWDNSSVNGNRRGDYAKSWRHVHQIFEAEGANQYAIWLWAPNRVNQIPSQPPPAAFYPGDDVVDWIGMSGYHRPGDEETSFEHSYGMTLPLLRQAGRKPIFLAEIGATELGGKKHLFIADLFRGLQANPDIIGFAWFSLTVTSTDQQGRKVTNDWRINSSGSAAAAMKEGLAASGIGIPRG